MKIRSFVCFFCFISLSANLVANENQVYKSVDSDGNVSFSDAPTGEAEKIKVKPLPTINLSPTPKIETYKPATTTEKDVAYSQLVITSPQEEEAIWNQPVITAQVKLQPGLKKNHTISIMLDDVALPGNGLSRPMKNLERGAHILNAHIKDAEGFIIQSAQPVQFQVHKTSVQN